MKKEPINERADTWNIGLVMLNLLNGDHIDSHDPKRIPQNLSDYADKHIYHPNLEALVFECLSLKPRDRPQIKELLWRTRKGLERWQNVVQDVSGLDVPLASTLQWDQEELAVGGRVPEHWRWAVAGAPGAC
jgi:serine/threonine protein kinase